MRHLAVVEAVAHPTDHVFSHLPVRRWVLSVPKRLRYFMQRDEAVLNTVLRLFLRVIAPTLNFDAQFDLVDFLFGSGRVIHGQNSNDS